jgi:putative addiction module killer protein
MIRIEEYIREDGASPYKAWFDKLDAQAAAKVTVATMRLGLGNTASLKSLAGGLAELRIDWGPGLRVYLAQDGETLVVLFGGGTKRSQQADIARARALLAEYKARKKAAAAARAPKSRE